MNGTEEPFTVQCDITFTHCHFGAACKWSISFPFPAVARLTLWNSPVHPPHRSRCLHSLQPPACRTSQVPAVPPAAVALHNKFRPRREAAHTVAQAGVHLWVYRRRLTPPTPPLCSVLPAPFPWLSHWLPATATVQLATRMTVTAIQEQDHQVIPQLMTFCVKW